MKCGIVLLVCIAGCGELDSSSSESRIAFTQIQTAIAPTVCGASTPTQILEVNGTGLALFDYDNDGDLDLFVVNAALLTDYSSGPGCRLYANVSKEEIVFEDVTEQSNINLYTWANGVAVGDVNGDGFDDLYVTCHGPNVLLVNNGDGTFDDTTEYAGVGDDRWGTSARFGDLDGDGDLDLYVCNYLEYNPAIPMPRAKYKGQSVLGGPHGMKPQLDIVYENVGNGKFKDVTLEWGFAQAPAFALNAAILDFNGDGKQDVFVGNDSMSNFLYLNTGEHPVRFEDVGMQSGVSVNGDGAMQATMGIGIADVDGNGRPDVFTTNFSSDTNTLHLNDPSGFFDDRTKKYGLGLMSRSLLGWTCGFHDFDLDGDEDLLVVNGHVYPEATELLMDSERSQPMLVLQRNGNRFIQQESTMSYRDRTAVFGDVDKDGDIDVIVAQRDGEVRVLRNNASGLEPITIHLVGMGLNPKGLGAKVQVLFKDGTVLSRWNVDGSGFQSSFSAPILLSIPREKEILHIEVVWADGMHQTLTQVPRQGELLIHQSVQQ